MATQNERVLLALTLRPGLSVMELQQYLQPFVSNPRARISDLRAAGNLIECRRRMDGRKGFFLRQPTLGL